MRQVAHPPTPGLHLCCLYTILATSALILLTFAPHPGTGVLYALSRCVCIAVSWCRGVPAVTPVVSRVCAQEQVGDPRPPGPEIHDEKKPADKARRELGSTSMCEVRAPGRRLKL
jgi:hypothetical protein